MLVPSGSVIATNANKDHPYSHAFSIPPWLPERPIRHIHTSVTHLEKAFGFFREVLQVDHVSHDNKEGVQSKRHDADNRTLSCYARTTITHRTSVITFVSKTLPTGPKRKERYRMVYYV